ncbi:MAG TPA: PIG-L family deacetylase [Phototrophicaceae bacterium]|jgi:LmbE family N-acetylglucosaminyl deacetylase|nr:PIG-L family deacetylase [Phototrophicaceae bacterium]
MNILAIGAHGDDLEMFCGGTLARFATRGDKVFMAVVTDGRGRPKGDPEQIVAIRKQEAEHSAAVIGAESVWMGQPDGGLWFDDATRHQFIEVIRECKPDLIITHPPDDYHPDHKTTSRLVMDAAQIARTANYPSKFAPHREIVPVAFMEAERGIGFIPEEYVDITSVWDQKIAMLSAHRSQLMPEVYDPNFVVPPLTENPFYYYALALGMFRGLAVNTRYAEGFRFWQAANRLVTHRVLP